LDDNLFAYPAVKASATAKAAGGVLSFTATLPASSGASYAATCQSGGAPLSAAWDGKTVVADTPYPFEANPGAIVNCTVTGTLGDLTASDVATATATAVDDTSVTVTAEAGGVSVRWTVADFANSSMATVSVSCTQGSETIYTNADASGSSYLVETEDISAAVTCTVDTAFSVNGGASTSVNSVTRSATPEESLSQGLPVWLLYIATQPE
jgi:hypothetical protein